MKTINTFLISLLCLISAGLAHAVTPLQSIEEFRGEGTVRTYLFIYDFQEIGRLESKYIGEDVFENTDAYKFEEKLTFNYSALNNPLKIAVICRHYVDEHGIYAGTDMNSAVDTNYQALHLKREADSIVGNFTSDETVRKVSIALSPSFRSIDNNMIDQLEMFLAFRGIDVGDKFNDSVFVPQMIQKTVLKGTVESFEKVTYGNLSDSAYRISFTDPAIQTVYFTKSRKIIKVDLETQNISIILSENPIDKLTPPSPVFTLHDFIVRLPYYAIYLLIGLIFALPFIRNNYKSAAIYIALILGGILFTLIESTQIPLQKWYAEAYLIPGMKAGGSLYLYGIVNALISGVIQEAFKFLLIAALFFIRRPKLRPMIAIGFFAGLGFGIYEACSVTGMALQSGQMSIWSWGLFERFFTILFHAATGAFMGYGLVRGLKYILIIWSLVAILHTFTNYLIVFVHRGIIDIGIYELSFTLIVLIFVLIVYFVVSRSRR